LHSPDPSRASRDIGSIKLLMGTTLLSLPCSS
jgi:hypothetical protein